MRQFNFKPIVLRYIGKKIINSTYRSLQLVWQAVRSCFGSGSWKNEQSWNNSDAWKNN